MIDPKAAYAPFKIPTYNDLKSIYYGQSKAQKSTITTLSPVADKNVYLREGDLTISAGISGSGIALIFVDGNLIITSNLTYGAAPSNGLVFVVSGNVYIAQGVNRVNGVIISQGEICTASQGSPPTCPAGLTDGLSPSQSLVVVGSLINLDPAKPIRFRRNLTSNAGPAEQIVHQAKYLVLLRDIFSSTLQKWSEIP